MINSNIWTSSGSGISRPALISPPLILDCLKETVAQVRGSIISVSKDPRGIIIRNRSVARNKGLSTWFLQVDIYIYIYIRWINVDQPCIPKKIDEAFIDYTEMRCHDSELYFICRPWWSNVFKWFRLIFWHCGWTGSKNEILSIKNEDYKFMIISYKSKLDKRNVAKLLQKNLKNIRLYRILLLGSSQNFKIR